ncbi:hypothetical protein SLEP1_g7108 [Rubroshorea leprosula]|uniref:soluble epoxide hydrolase n=1 Tax=Rubroshorea leprosula TaxID=152421 RepID=A0AAV5I789_9ROSI|nr:hypothetical protein SLEP1_g7108 [Rubroshorea leprosula]
MEGIEHRTFKVNGINIHVAEKGQGPLILFLHGFPELWYSWRHQILALASLGYRAVAPDLRGYGETDAPDSIDSYSCFHVVGDLIALLDAVAAHQEKVFLVGHDWGAIIGWFLCLFRPDRVKAFVGLSVPYLRSDPAKKPVEAWRSFYGDDYYICRFQEPGEIETEFAQIGTEELLKEFFTYRLPDPFRFSKGTKPFGHGPESPVALPPWLSEEDIKYYASKFEKTGFTGGVNYYRNMNRNCELLAPWVGSEIKVPAKFVVGDQDLVYHMPGMKDYIHGESGLKKDVPLLEEVVVMEGVAHFINQEKAEEISNHIFNFINKFN